jgi:hypothetical protein
MSFLLAGADVERAPGDAGSLWRLEADCRSVTRALQDAPLQARPKSGFLDGGTVYLRATRAGPASTTLDF